MYIPFIILTIVFGRSFSDDNNSSSNAIPLLRRANRPRSHFFRQPSEHDTSEVFFDDPNKVLIKEDDIWITLKTLIISKPNYCRNMAKGLHVGTIVTHKLNIYHKPDHADPDVATYLHYMYGAWDTMRSNCNASKVVFVSCIECHTCKTFDHKANTSTNTLSFISNSLCHEALLEHNQFNNGDNNNDIECFTHIVEPRIAIFEQLLNGTHHCYTDWDISIIEWILFGFLIFAIVVILIAGIVYGLVELCNIHSKQSHVVKSEICERSVEK